MRQSDVDYIRGPAQEEEEALAAIHKLAGMKPNYLEGAIQGATLAWIFGFLANKPAKGNRLKYGAWGAGLYMLAQFGWHKFVGGTDVWMHEYASTHPLRAPRSPVVTSGYFAGSPRPLYHAVGAPPSSDYSFTRRPGFNSKDY
jgi:hypothetical protein